MLERQIGQAARKIDYLGSKVSNRALKNPLFPLTSYHQFPLTDVPCAEICTGKMLQCP
jgi:hypothetical protein